MRRAKEPLQAFASVVRNPALRRIELAWLGSVAGEWAAIVALGVFAYREGGTAAVGLVGLIRMLPSSVAAPFASLLADRFARERVMVAADLARAVAVGGAAAGALMDGPPALVYGLAGFVAVVSTAFRPAQAAILPSLASGPEELAAANVVSSTIESVAFFAGPALGGLLLAATSPGWVFAAQAGAFLWSAALLLRLKSEGPAREATATSAGLGEELLGGFRAIGRDARLRLILGLFGAQTLVHGAMNVFVVALALQVLEIGASGVGFLTSADGIGGILGGLVALGLVGRRGLAARFGVGLALWGLPIALIGVWPQPTVVFMLLACVGVANAIVDVSGLTLLQRSIPDEVLARVFGILESLVLGTIAVGAVLAPVLVSALGVRGAFVMTGAFLPVLAVLSWRRLAALDALSPARPRESELLRGVPFLTALPAPTLEGLAGALEPVRVAAADEIVRAGEAGERFYVIDEGEVDVTVSGESVGLLGSGEYFGEIALLRDIPRTATITARTDVSLYALGRNQFVAAVTGHAPSADSADAVVSTRLASLRPDVASL